MSDYVYPEAILFDHDGTLVDTEPVWAEAKEAISHKYGKEWSEQDTLDALGQPMQVTYDILRRNGVPLSDEEIYDALVSHAIEHVKNESVELLPGIANLLQEVADAGIPCAIVTNATHHVAEVTAGLAPEGLFKTIVTNDDVENAKPDPEPYLLAAQRLGVDPTKCVAVEDSPSGVASASAAGLKVVVVPGMQPVPEGKGDVRLKHEDLTLEQILKLNNSK